MYPNYFLYPVGFLNQGKIILLIKQQSKDHISLLLWDRETKEIKSGLWSLFNPAAIQVLPNQAGFSFIDNGRLRVKFFNKRSPRTIEFDQYVYDIRDVNWLNSNECYFSAKTIDDCYSIFHGFIDGTTFCLASCSNNNCMYPQKIDDQLFYIKETKEKKYQIIQTQFSDNTEKIADIMINFNNPIVFLLMLSPEKGFVIQHANKINSTNINVEFNYYQLLKSKKNDLWEKKLLFSFKIPFSLISTKSHKRLYESLLPLVPRVVGTNIYFVDSSYNKQNKLELFSYSIKTLKIKQLLLGKSKQYCNLFVPIVFDSKIIFGGEICD
jgi:hypothetical protein